MSTAAGIGLEKHEEVIDASADPLFGTEDYLSTKLIAKHGERLRYVSEAGKWFEWNGHVWANERTLKIFEFAKLICREHVSTLPKGGKGGESFGRAATHYAVEKICRSHRGVAMLMEQFDSDPWLLNCPGGVVDLKTGKIIPNSPEQYHTKSTTVMPAPGIPSLWLDCLNTWMGGDQELIDYLQRLFGYCLTSDVREDSFHFFWGAGRNGKGTTCHAIQEIMGNYAKPVSIDEFLESKHPRHETGLAALIGARAVFGSEPNENSIWDENKLKACTGRDKLRARFMRQDFVDFDTTFKIVISGNKKPLFRTIDTAWRRRLHLVPWLVEIPREKIDTTLPERLKLEYPQILSWLIDGCLRWQAEGLNPPKAILTATEQYFEEQDRVGNWINEKCIQKPGALCTLAAAYAAYKDWCENNGERFDGKIKFGKQLDGRAGIKREKGNSNVPMVFGLGLRDG